jgi:hypothetical protein
MAAQNTISGVKAVTTAGTAVQLNAGMQVNGPVTIKALTGNTGLIYIGGVNGDVQSTNGYPLLAGDMVILDQVGNLSEIWVNSAVNGEGVAWLLLRW